MESLSEVSIKGFKSIKECDLELRPLNVMIGANGAGKSNLISFFRMLNEMMAGRFQHFIATSGRAQSVLHRGPRVTHHLEAQLEFGGDGGTNSYRIRLDHAPVDTLIFAEEVVDFTRRGPDGSPIRVGLRTMAHQESRVFESTKSSDEPGAFVRHFLGDCRVYHFHDTSPTSRLRQYSYVGNNQRLMPDAANLAAVLHRFREGNEFVYRRIIGTVRLIAPFFDDFELARASPHGRDIILDWRQRDSDRIFGPHQLSDGTLRAICLITLLLQPAEELPRLIVVDEPELGLHPYALNVIASLFGAVANHTQVLIGTQSSTFLDNFDPVDVVVVDREGAESRFTRPDPSALEAWLEEYSLGEIWEKNVIAGGPH